LAKKKGVLAKDAKINLPRYKKIKNEAIDQFLKAKIISAEMTYDRGNFTKKGREVSLTPMTIDGKKLKSKIQFRLPEYLEEVTINTITITKNGTGYVANIAYRKEGFSVDVTDSLPDMSDKILGIDLGLNNLATTVNTVNGESMIIDGKYLKSVNQYYNKTVAELRSNMDLTKQQAEKDKYFKRIQKATVRRNRTVRDFMHKVAKRIAHHAHELDVSDVVVGYNQGWKSEINLGCKTNQKFVQIPYRKLIDALRDKLQEVGIHLRETEESYTSKIDHLANEPMQHQEAYLGKRKKRGLFQSSTNRLINADVNGAIGIIQKTQKSNDHSALQRIVSSGRFFRPVRIYPGVAKHDALKKTASCRKAA
jgi:putative transposase